MTENTDPTDVPDPEADVEVDAEATVAASAQEIAAADQVAAEAAAAQAAREEQSRDRKGVIAGWAFLAALFAIFLALVLWAVNQNDGDTTESTSATTEAVAASGTPTTVEFVAAEDGSVVLSGSVPDEGARRQLFDAAIGIFGEGKVTDELVVDDSVTLVGGTIDTSGIAPHDDSNVAAMVTAAKQLGLAEGNLGAGFSDQVLTPVAANATLATNTVSLDGAFPEQSSIDLFAQAASDVFGAGNVDVSGAFVDSSTTLQGATLSVNGLLDAGDTRGALLVNELGASFPGSIVDGSGLGVDTSPEALGRLEVKLRGAIEASPILFNSGSAEIDEASATILDELAQAIMAAPGIPVEIVGHTDDSGGEALNQALSQDRAIAVLNRLVELGVDVTRLKARGAGEAEPIADNGTPEGQAANRRIAFEFEGATDEG